MPALITHHLFGEDAASALPDGILTSQEELLAFLLGNQGPDPLFARWLATPQVAASCHTLASAMHEACVAEAFLALRRGVSHLPDDDKKIGRAFALGMLAHYVLDSGAHAFVYAQQDALAAALPELSDAAGELHAVIESDLDSWMLWSYRRLSVADVPATVQLARTDRIVRVAGALVSAVALEVFGIALSAKEYGRAVRDFELFYRAIDNRCPQVLAALSALETTVRPHSRLAAQAHRPTTSDDCAAANLGHSQWTNPYTGEVRTESFPDLYFAALDTWRATAAAFVAGEKNALLACTNNLNYDGRPLAR